MTTSRRTYEIIILGFLAALNTVFELTLGNYLHAVKFPVAAGLIIGLNVIVYTIGYAAVPRRGSVVMMGFITAILNLLLSGSFKIMAIPAIFFESVIIETFFSTFGLRLGVVIIASITAALFGFAWSLIFPLLFLNRSIYDTIIIRYSSVIGGPEVARQFFIGAIIFFTALHVATGTAFGFAAWRLNQIIGKVTKKAQS